MSVNQRLHDEHLKVAQQDIIEVISVNLNALNLKLDREHQKQEKIVEKDREQATKRHAETVAAIVTTRDGVSRTIAATGHNAAPYPGIQSMTSYRQTSDTENHDKSVHGAIELRTADLRHFSQVVEDGLHFREIHDRGYSVKHAYDSTLEWVFRDPARSDRPWHNFSDWLSSGSGCYWISGKAGSGKSTLMKFAQSHNRTRAALGLWARPKELLVGSFYFWYAGTILQKSQEGLLRSLLLCVLRQRPNLAASLFPDFCRSYLSAPAGLPIKFTHTELRRAFDILAGLQSPDLKVCFFIDGVDEYGGDFDSIFSLLTDATNSQWLKLVVSSRPIPSCVFAFSSYPNLRVQDLTHGDIERFAHHELGQYSLMQRLESNDPGATAELVNGITSKASGVFLWVAVVVKLLQRGLQDYDTIADLRYKLEALPEDLERLYSHMLGSMSTSNRQQGSKLLQLALYSSYSHGQYPMTLLQLSFAEEEDYLAIFEAESRVRTKAEKNWRCESIEGRLRSRCCGLLEVTDYPASQENGRCVAVSFVHRTAVEFLQNRENWAQLLQYTQGADFDVYSALLYSSCMELRAELAMLETHNISGPSFHTLLRSLSYSRYLFDYEEYQVFLEQVFATMKAFWNDDAAQSDRLELALLDHFLVYSAYHLTDSQYTELLESQPLAKEEILACVLTQYIDERRPEIRSLLAKQIASQHLDSRVKVTLPLPSNLWNARWSRESNSVSLWKFLLHYLLDLLSTYSYSAHSWVQTGLADSILDILESFLRGGAGPGVNKEESSIIYRFLVWRWKGKARNVTERSDSVTMLSDDDDLANKACTIESLIPSGAKYRTSAPVAPTPAPVEETSPSSDKKALRSHRSARTPIVLKPPKSFSHINRPDDWARTPWQDFVNSLNLEKEDPISASQAHMKKDNQLRKNWSSTPRSQRLRLLGKNEQELVAKLTQVDLTAREKRQLQSQLRRLSLEMQGRVMEVARVVQKKADDGNRGI